MIDSAVERGVRWRAIGPGILFAGAAIGVSHLVQSTRAGAGYGLGLLVVVLLANAIKYPAFSFGPRFAAATGCSLLEGYRRQGRWALVLYALITVGTMFTVEAAVVFTTAAIALAVFRVDADPLLMSVGLLAGSIALLIFGHYRLLDRIVKVVVVVLTVLTVAATISVLPAVDWGTIAIVPEGVLDDVAALSFVAALIGWMPSAIDISVWHSLWGLARRRESGYRPTVDDALFDFNIGYLATAVLAVCFVVLGAGVVHGTSAETPSGAAGFAAALLDLYARSLGPWARPVLGGAVLLVMVSTTITVVDGFPRSFSALIVVFRDREVPGRDVEVEHRPMYWGGIAVVAVGAILILTLVRSRLLLLVDMATILSFLTAPILAVLNHRAVYATDDPPGAVMRGWSMVSIVILSAFAVGFLYIRAVSL